MKKRHTLLIVATAILVLTFGIMTSCDDSNLINPKPSESQGIPTEDIQFVQWKADISTNLKTLNKVTTSEKIFTQEGGVLATEDMYGCKLTVPANAFDETERLIQAHLLSENDNIAGISFLPSQQFTKYVTIELPFAAINVDETDVNNIRAFWLDENTSLWIEIHDIIVDKNNQVVKAQIDHFTRFGWGF